MGNSGGSGGKVVGVRVWRWAVPVTAGVVMILLFLAGCSSSSSTTSTAAPSYGLLTSRWPPGIEAVVLSAETGLYVVDSEGVRWAKGAPQRTKTTTTSRGMPVVSGLDGLAVSERFVAYVDAGEEIVVRSLADGTVFKRMAIENQGHTTLRSLSDDGTMLALVTVDPELEAQQVENMPWTVTVVNLATGTATVADALAAFVEERIADRSSGGCGLVELHWLPGDTLQVGVSGQTVPDLRLRSD